MQLRQYVGILRRFWLLLVLLPLLVGALSLALELREPPRYAASARLAVSQTPRLAGDEVPFADFNLNHSWISSEFILDDIPFIVTSRAFAEDVSALLAEQGYAIAPEAAQAGLSASTLHRTVTLAAVADSPERAELLVQGAVVALQTNGLRYWSRADEVDTGLSVAVLDPVGGAALLNGPRQLVRAVGLRVGLALAAAVGVAFLWYYLDDRLRNRQQVEEWVGVPVVAVIPREKE
jgi:capsular polysaccharide biosynthesis protein